jgi:hypothetical protein
VFYSTATPYESCPVLYLRKLTLGLETRRFGSYYAFAYSTPQHDSICAKLRRGPLLVYQHGGFSTFVSIRSRTSGYRTGKRSRSAYGQGFTSNIYTATPCTSLVSSRQPNLGPPSESRPPSESHATAPILNKRNEWRRQLSGDQVPLLRSDPTHAVSAEGRRYEATTAGSRCNWRWK